MDADGGGGEHASDELTAQDLAQLAVHDGVDLELPEQERGLLVAKRRACAAREHRLSAMQGGCICLLCEGGCMYAYVSTKVI